MLITLLTDFGLSGPYVASMKGVILSICPDARIVDISHTIAPQNVEEAAFVLHRIWRDFPEGTIHTAVVDPGVGSARAALGVHACGHIFLAPDNGILKHVFDACPERQIFHLTNETCFRTPVSATFHGRDIFASVAAHLARGVPLESMGDPFDGYMTGDVKKPVRQSDRIDGEILYVDGFGNGVTNIPEEMIPDMSNVTIQIHKIQIKGLVRTYADVPSGNMLALTGSGGTLEISMRNGCASGKVPFVAGDSVTVLMHPNSATQ